MLNRKEFIFILGAALSVHAVCVIALLAKSVSAGFKVGTNVKSSNEIIDLLLPLNYVWPSVLELVGDVYYLLINGLLLCFLPCYVACVLYLRRRQSRGE